MIFVSGWSRNGELEAHTNEYNLVEFVVIFINLSYFISSQMSYEIESRLRTRYTLIDRSDPTAIAAAQQLGILINDQGELVGEADGTGFGIGPASNSKLALSGSVIGIKKKEAKKSRSKEKLA